MQDLKKDLRLALVQLEPVLFDKAACLGNTLKKIGRGCRKRCRIHCIPRIVHSRLSLWYDFWV